MGFSMVPLWLSLAFLYLSITNADTDGGIVSATSNPPSPPPPLRQNTSPFRPSIAVIVGILTTMFSITFLLLLYAKHCKRRNGYPTEPTSSRGVIPSTSRKNSGIDRTVVESLPVFRFGSLMGQKEGLECAVCLNRFEPVEALRLLPKCKHAFHVECVDTWLDAHSTCPLCRYRVDPEDILLLVEGIKIEEYPPPQEDREMNNIRRVSGRHSAAGERSSGSVQILVEKHGESSGTRKTTSFNARKSLDSFNQKRISGWSEAVGCFEKPRKDGLLLDGGPVADRASFDRRFDHRIIVSGEGSSSGTCGDVHHRWSDVQPSDLLYLRSEMIISDNRRRFSNSRGVINDGRWQREKGQSGSSVINTRSVSEITGLSRLSNNHNQPQQQQEHLQAGVVSRWLAWISQSQPAVRSGQTSVVL